MQRPARGSVVKLGAVMRGVRMGEFGSNATLGSGAIGSGKV